MAVWLVKSLTLQSSNGTSRCTLGLELVHHRQPPLEEKVAKVSKGSMEFHTGVTSFAGFMDFFRHLQDFFVKPFGNHQEHAIDPMGEGYTFQGN